MPVILGDNLPAALIEMLADDVRVVPWTESPAPETAEVVAGIVTYGHPNVDGPLLDSFPNVRVVSNHGVGVDHIDVAAARARNVPVGNTPGCLDQATADMTMALLLATARNVVTGDRYARSPEFTHYDPSILIGHEVWGSTLGIIGLGRIGRQVARRAAAFDMTVLYHNRKPDPAAEAEFGVRYAPFSEILSASDFLTLNCPLTSETHHLIGREEFDRMKSSAVLINMARGGVVDTDALHEALQQKKIAAAGIDVTDPEPLPRDHLLLACDNLVVTPHLGSAADRTRLRMMQMTVENLTAGMDGKPLPWAVT